MKKNYIAHFYPKIMKALEAGATHKDVADYIFRQSGVKVSRALIVKTINEIQNKTFIKSFKKQVNELVCFYPIQDDSKSKYIHFAVNRYGLWFIPSAALEQINAEWIISVDNISKLNDPIAKVISKWLLQEFNLSNESLFSSMKLSDEQIDLIAKIPETINDSLNDIANVAKINYIKWIWQ